MTTLPEAILKEIVEKTGWDEKEVRELYEGMGEAIQEASLVHPHNIVHVALIRDLNEGAHREIPHALARELLECFACSSFLMLYPDIRRRLMQIVEAEEQPAEPVDPERAFFVGLREKARREEKGSVKVEGIRDPYSFLEQFSGETVEVDEEGRVQFPLAAYDRTPWVPPEFEVDYGEFRVKVTWDPDDPTEVKFKKLPKPKQKDG